jgi:hypothetical protein
MQERKQPRRARRLRATAPLLASAPLMAMPVVCAEVEEEEEEEERCRARVGVMRGQDGLIAN